MNRKMKAILKILCLTIIFAFPQIIKSQTMDITVTNIRSPKGKIVVLVFTNDTDFKANKASEILIFDKPEIKDKSCKISIPYKPGVFGISICDDESGNGKMDYNFVGVPKEGFGFSNFVLKKLSRPLFSDFSFQLKANETKSITVEIKYL